MRNSFTKPFKPSNVLIWGTVLILFLTAYMKAHRKSDKMPNHSPVSLTASAEPLNKQEYHRCTSQWIPYVSSLLETAQYLRYHPQSSFVRYGDGEVALITHNNLSFQAADNELATALLRPFSEDINNLMIGIPDIFSGFPPMNQNDTDWWHQRKNLERWFLAHTKRNVQYLNAKITALFYNHPDTCILLNKTYNELRSIWRDKDIVLLRGDNHQKYDFDVFDTARSVKTLYAPRYQAWTDYPKLKRALFREQHEKLFILTAGPVSKVLTIDLAKAGIRALDLGHMAKDYDVYMGRKRVVDFYVD